MKYKTRPKIYSNSPRLTNSEDVSKMDLLKYMKYRSFLFQYPFPWSNVCIEFHKYLKCQKNNVTLSYTWWWLWMLVANHQLNYKETNQRDHYEYHLSYFNQIWQTFPLWGCPTDACQHGPELHWSSQTEVKPVIFKRADKGNYYQQLNQHVRSYFLFEFWVYLQEVAQFDCNDYRWPLWS